MSIPDACAATDAQYVGLDVSMRKTAICVINAAGEREWSGPCPSVPEAMIAAIRQRAPRLARVGLETGPLAVWHSTALAEAGLPVVCLHAAVCCHRSCETPHPSTGSRAMTF